MTDPRRDEYLDSVLIGGREPVSIVVCDYDSRWSDRFADLRERLRTALGPRALGIEHIGSTSVPGLAAKPIIDVLLIVDSVADEGGYLTALEQAGFVLRVREPGHRVFRTPEKDVHIHVYDPDAQAVDDYLDLRDWLRRSKDDRDLYASTKRHLARQEWSDMNHYAEAKSEVIAGMLARARSWRSSRRDEE